MRPKDATLVVIPTYNEVENLADLLAQIAAAAPAAHVLVVDDGSPDGTGELADELARQDDRVHVIHRPAKLGMGTAYVEAFAWALAEGYAQVAQLDADGSHDPRALPALLDRLAEADLVIGSRAVDGGGVAGWGAHRRLLSGAGHWYCRALLGWGLRDPTSGYRALSRRALELLAERPVRSEGFAFQIEVAYRIHRRGLTVVEHPILFTDRARGHSKMTAEIVLEALLVVPLLRLNAMVGAFDPRR